MDEAQFRLAVDEALAELPEEFKSQLKNVEITIEDEPTDEQRETLNLRSHNRLFGLYTGIPQTVPGEDKAVLPDRIVLFRRAITEAYDTPEGIKEQIKETLYHEIGHFFGLDESRLRQLRRGK